MARLPERIRLSLQNLLTLFIVPFFLISCPGEPTPKEPKADLEKVTITVVDRFDQPITQANLLMKREYRRAMSLQPYEEVGRAETNEDGIAIFDNVKEDDWITESNSDNRFSGTVTMEEGKTEYLLKINSARISSIGYSSGIEHIDAYEQAADRIMATLNKILAYYVEKKQNEFFAPSYYVKEGVISESDAKHLVAMGSRMDTGPKAINFSWGGENVRVSGLDEPITWVDAYEHLR